jgi:hypothetical protein
LCFGELPEQCCSFLARSPITNAQLKVIDQLAFTVERMSAVFKGVGSEDFKNLLKRHHLVNDFEAV